MGYRPMKLEQYTQVSSSSSNRDIIAKNTKTTTVPLVTAFRAQYNMSSSAGQKRKLGDNNIMNKGQEVVQPRRKKMIKNVETSPADIALHLFKENGYDVLQQSNSKIMSTHFIKPTEDMISAYKIETIKAARSEKIDELRKILQRGESLDCCNQFGESLLHMACRRGNLEMVKFLLEEANVTINLRDDFGRTALHDACWTSKPKFDLVLYLIQKVPDYLYIKDVRGHYPLNYVRKEHWNEWNTFIVQNKQYIRPKLFT